MINYLLAPNVGFSAVVTYACIVVDHCTVEVEKEEIGGDGICECRTVVALVFVVPVVHCVMVCVRKGDGVNALIHLNELVGKGADGGDAVLLCKVYV